MFSQLGLRGGPASPAGGVRAGQRTSDSVSSANVKILLFDMPMPPGDGNPLSAYHEASFTGYTQQFLNPSTAGSWPAGTKIQIGDAGCGDYTFTAGAIGSPVTIYGYGIVDDTAVPHELLVAVPFAEPVPLAAMGDNVKLHNLHWQAAFFAYAESVVKAP